MINKNNTLSIYIHIPFCKSRCGYCAFFSSVLSDTYQDDYTVRVIEELKYYSEKFKEKILKTVYLGGGTPSLLSLSNLEKITMAIYKNFNCKIDEFTIEVNPLSSENIKYYKDFGINRISMGIQSFDESILKKLGRNGDYKSNLKALEIAAANFKNVSGDLIIGVNEGQDIKSDFAILKDYIKHLSCYMLKIEQNTKLFSQCNHNLVSIATEDDTVRQYNDLVNVCTANGYHRYEVSNFSLLNYQSKHNLRYWDMSAYLGIGAGAYSYVNKERFHNISDIKKYIEKSPVIYDRNNNIDDEIEEFIMLSLRMDKGLVYENFLAYFGFDFLGRYGEKIKFLAHYLDITDKGVSIKKEFYLVQNSVISQII